jgi:3-dehydroquinate synthase
MKKLESIKQRFSVTYSYPVVFTHDVFKIDNPILSSVLNSSGQTCNRILIVIDSGVFQSTLGLAEKIDAYAKHHHGTMDMVSSPYIMRGGEECKKEPDEVEAVTALINQHHLCRHSFVLAIGGGAVLDAAGFAAGIAHRGIRLIRLPTTTLSQNDAGVGVKNGINGFGRKNFLGIFAPPFAVINDFEFLKTLPARHLRAGIAEGIKVSLIKDRGFFDFLYKVRRQLAALKTDVIEKVVKRCAELHLNHIAKSGDPFEFGSSRPLDFGHWSAHKLEELTQGGLTHGEAVAVGMALDSFYSWQIGLLKQRELNKILSTLEDIGFDLYHPYLRKMDIEKALREFQEHLGGTLTIPLLKGIGARIDVHEIKKELMEQAVDFLRERKKERRK